LPRFLTLDVEQGQLHLSSAQVRSNSTKIERALIVPDVGAMTAATAPEIGRRLREALKDAGVAPAPVLISVGREKLVLKEIKLPAGITPAEEANVIRFQAQKELTEAGDSVVIDYFAAPIPEADGQRRALAFAMRKDLTNAYKALCAAAGLKLVGITPRPFGAMASYQKAIKDGAVMPPASAEWPVAVLTLGEKWAELLIGKNGNIIFSRPLTTTALSSEAALLASIRNNLAVFNGQSPQNQVRALYVVEAETAGRWQGRIQDGISLPTFAYDPLAGVDGEVTPESRANFAALIGLFAYALRPSTLPVNFLAPHEPRVARDPKQQQQITIAAAVGLLLVGAIAFGRWKVADKDTEIERLTAAINDAEEETKRLDPAWKEYKAVADWQNSGVNWLDELYDLTARFPDPKDTRLDLFVGQPVDQQQGAAAKNSKEPKHAAKLDLTVSTLSHDAVMSLNDSLRNDRYYILGGPESKGAVNAGAATNRPDAKPRQLYVLRSQLDHRDPRDYQMKLIGDAGARREAPAAPDMAAFDEFEPDFAPPRPGGNRPGGIGAGARPGMPGGGQFPPMPEGFPGRPRRGGGN
jgi:Tfp pilus assembly PilM family ATPase